MKDGIFLVTLWWLIWVISTVQGENGCKHFLYMDCIENKAMTGHVIKISKVISPGLEMCQNQCFEEDQCVSYNLGPVDGAIRTCELNAADHWMRPAGFLVAKEGFGYCPIENHCSSSPCPANRLCTPDFEWDTYSCSDGGWTQWNRWTACSYNSSCPHVRKRSCSNPAPQNNGKNCTGPDTQTNQCKLESVNQFQNCDSPLGMEDGRIKDEQITASTYYNDGLKPEYGRLNRLNDATTYGAWAAKQRAINDWIQVDLLSETIITKIAIQKRDRNIQYVKRYAVTFSNDDTFWFEGDCVKTYQGNGVANTIVTTVLAEPIKARYIRLIVKEFYSWPSMRFELYGCSP